MATTVAVSTRQAAPALYLRQSFAPELSLADNAPLNSARREVRLLQILPGNGADDIRCTLRVASLDQKPHYNALSYAWGDGVSDGVSGAGSGKSIEVNGRKKDVTASLYSALRHMRSLKTPRVDQAVNPPLVDQVVATPIWIDALCINQDDADERRLQVAMMADIYLDADRVMIFLGEGNALTDYLFRSINSRRFRAWLESSADRDLELVQAGGAGRADITRAVTSFWAFFEIFSRPWWGRVWVVQEVALARRDPLVVCGKSAVMWKDLAALQSDLLKFSQLANRIHLVDWTLSGMQETMFRLSDLEMRKTAVVPYYSMLTVRGLVDDFRSGNASIFAFQTFFMGTARATDPRDYVYGYRGLVSPAVRDYLEVDYTKQPMQVFYEIMVLLWLSRDTVRMNFIEQFAFTRPPDDFPTWVPDLSQQHVLRAPNNNRGLFPPDGAAIWRWGEVPELEDDGKTLMMRGVFIDHIHTSDEMRFVENAADENDAAYILGFWRTYNAALAATQRRAPELGDYVQHQLHALIDAVDVLDVLTTGAASPEVRATLQDIVDLGSLVGSDAAKMGQLCGFLLKMVRTLSAEHTTALTLLMQTIQRRSLVATDGGFVGVGLHEARRGDLVVFLFGMSWPWILRPGRPGYYTIVGPAYIGGLSDFDRLDQLLEEGTLQTEVFAIR